MTFGRAIAEMRKKLFMQRLDKNSLYHKQLDLGNYKGNDTAIGLSSFHNLKGHENV